MTGSAICRRSIPPEFEGRIKFRDVTRDIGLDTTLTYPPGTGAIQMRLVADGDGKHHAKIWIWQASPGSLATYEAWFCASRHATSSSRPR